MSDEHQPTMQVDTEIRPLLYDASGRPLRQRVGFAPAPLSMQTRGTNPSLYTNTKKATPKGTGGKKG